MFSGKHYETGTLANALTALGSPVSEAMVLAASGGIAFGYFVFEYQGDLPHVALLTRNTFAPFERALDNLGVKREVRVTTDAAKGEKNLRNALDDGLFPIVWADAFSLPYLGLPNSGMWMMRPLLVVGQENGGFLVVDGAPDPILISASDMARARGKVKKDRYKIFLCEPQNDERFRAGIKSGIETANALMLDKPPAGSADNFGIQGIRAFAKALTDIKGPKAWRTKFEPGPRLVQALAGRIGQPGIWDWIETWGTAGGGDRGTYAAFLREAGPLLGQDFHTFAERLEESAVLWHGLADESMPSAIPEFARLKELKTLYATSRSERGELREEIRALIGNAGRSALLDEIAADLQRAMADKALQIAEIESKVFTGLRAVIAGS